MRPIECTARLSASAETSFAEPPAIALIRPVISARRGASLCPGMKNHIKHQRLIIDYHRILVMATSEATALENPPWAHIGLFPSREKSTWAWSSLRETIVQVVISRQPASDWRVLSLDFLKRLWCYRLLLRRYRLLLRPDRSSFSHGHSSSTTIIFGCQIVGEIHSMNVVGGSCSVQMQSSTSLIPACSRSSCRFDHFARPCCCHRAFSARRKASEGGNSG